MFKNGFAILVFSYVVLSGIDYAIFILSHLPKTITKHVTVVNF